MCLKKQERTVFSVGEKWLERGSLRKKKKQRSKPRQRQSSYLHNPRFWSGNAQRDQRQVVICYKQMGRHRGLLLVEGPGKSLRDWLGEWNFLGQVRLPDSTVVWEGLWLCRTFMWDQGWILVWSPKFKECKSTYVCVCVCVHTCEHFPRTSAKLLTTLPEPQKNRGQAKGPES